MQIFCLATAIPALVRASVKIASLFVTIMQ